MGKTVQTEVPQRKAGTGSKRAKGLPRRTGNSVRKAKYARNAAKQVPRKIAHTLKRNGPHAAAAIKEFYLKRAAGVGQDHSRLEFPPETGSVRNVKANLRMLREG